MSLLLFAFVFVRAMTAPIILKPLNPPSSTVPEIGMVLLQGLQNIKGLINMRPPVEQLF